MTLEPAGRGSTWILRRASSYKWRVNRHLWAQAFRFVEFVIPLLGAYAAMLRINGL